LHDIPLYADKANNTFNMVVEVPRWTNAKMEVGIIGNQQETDGFIIYRFLANK